MFFKVSEDGAWLILVDIISRSGIPLNEFTIFDFTMLLHHKVAQEVEKIFVPVADAKNPAGYHLEQQPILFPHRIINYIFNDVGLRIDERDIHQFWDNATAVGEPHVNESSRNKIPLGLYGDSAQLITKIRTEKLMCLWLNIPIFRPKAVRYSRFLMWCCDTSKLFGYRTTNSVLRWLTWSLNSLYDGVNPGRRPGNRPLSSEEEKRAGTPFLHSFQVVECRGIGSSINSYGISGARGKEFTPALDARLHPRILVTQACCIGIPAKTVVGAFNSTAQLISSTSSYRATTFATQPDYW